MEGNTYFVLADGTEYEIDESSSSSEVTIIFSSKESMIVAWGKMTDENLKSVQFKTEEQISGIYTDLVLLSEESIILDEGTIRTTFKLREKSETEKLAERVSALEEENASLKEQYEVHDGAIKDLGSITSKLNEKISEAENLEDDEGSAE